MKCGLTVLACFVALAGCTDNTSGPDGQAEPDGPVSLVLSAPVNVTGVLAREPAIVQGPDGALYVAGYQYGQVSDLAGVWFLGLPDYQQPPPVWKSIDAGRSWSRLDVGTLPDGAVGNSDIDLAMAPDGTLYVAVMTFSYLGHTIVVGNSVDAGASWAWSLISAQPLVDRPWVEVAPDGSAHVIWNDGVQVHHAASTDRGVTWLEGAIVHDRGGSGMLAVAPDGTLAVRVIPASGSGYTEWDGADGVAVSSDGGASWAFHSVPGTRGYGNIVMNDPGDGTPRWADPLGFDAAGTLYTAWGEGESLFLGRSSDLAASWDVVEIVRATGSIAYYPHLRAGPDAGTLAMTWFTWDGGDGFFAHVALVRGADSGIPTLRQVAFVPPTGGDTGGEYFQAIVLHDGSIGFAIPIQADEVGFAYRTAS